MRFLSSCNSIKIFYLSNLYTTIPHSKLKETLREFVQLCFIKKEWPTQIQIPCPRKGQILFCKKKHSDSTNMLEFLIDNIFVILGGCVFNRQSAYLWVQTVLLFSPTCSFIRSRQISYRGFSRKNEKKLARSFNFTFRYIDDVLSLNNSRLGDFVDRIYPIELEIKNTTYTDRSVDTQTYTWKLTIN